MTLPSAVPEHRPVRSFVRREGRLTPGQERAFATLWSRFGIGYDDSETLCPDAVFTRSAPCTLDIGFGDGEALLQQAQQQPERNFIGIEVHRPGIGHLLLRLQELDLGNIRVIDADAVELLQQRLVDACLDRVQIFFPDPWPKKRHHKRRLIQAGFVEMLAAKLTPGGILHLATDWEPYALQMLEILQQAQDFINTVDNPGAGFAPRPASRPQTKFERRGERLGHPVRDLIFRRR